MSPASGILRITFLGTGTSTGVPMIGCDCAVCHSPDPRDQRYRCSLWMQTDECQWVVDTGPDFRSQCLRAGVCHLDAVLITHPHTDHIMGFDDLRRFTFGEHERLPVYASPATLEALRRVYDFAFNGQNHYAGYFKPAPQPVTEPFPLGRVTVTPLPVEHGKVETHGYLFQYGHGPRVAYMPDCKRIPEPTLALLHGVDVLIVDALRLRVHPTHFSVAEALEAAARVQARQTWLTHLSHELCHAELEAGLPPHVRVAYDGLVLEL
jgi:phosphoribosyl 1,2-cyclic phosphate phosphodiesterase